MNEKTSSLERFAGIVGLLLTLALIGLIVWQEIKAKEAGPVIAVTVDSVRAESTGYRVEFVARNRTGVTASSVEIEGTLKGAGREPIVRHTNLDYVPGNSERKGGLFFPVDPATGQLELHATGYANP